MAVSASSSSVRPTFNAPDLHARIMRLRAIDDATNWLYIAKEYSCIVAVIAAVVTFCESRAGWGLGWFWNVPVMAAGMVLIGALQHRLAGLGHEASHYTLFRNKWLNDFVGDALCMFPVLGTTHFYRVFHLAHHQFTNDPERDPDLVSLGGSKMVDRFPMGRWEFVKSIYLRVFTEPGAFVRYSNDYFSINVLGGASNEYLKRAPGADASGKVWPRLGAVLGAVYLVFYILATWTLTLTRQSAWLPPLCLSSLATVLAVWALLPDRAFFPSPFRQPISPRVSGLMRLVYYTMMLTGLSLLREPTGGKSAVYYVLLWIVPLGTTFLFFMLLRDVYQHTNADDGRLTNSRVFFADPFTRWAVFVYGQDMHVPHHLFPAIPHYRLPQLHRLLKDRHADYAEQVVEVEGTFTGQNGRPSILDVLCEDRGE